MRKKLWAGFSVGCVAVGLVIAAGADARALNADPQEGDPKPKPGAPAGAAVDPKTIWPAGLEKLAGRYVFLQVASPGGLWERSKAKEPRQIALPDCPKGLQDKLKAAEIVISDLKLPSEITAEQRLSPSKRGMLRFYKESALGRLVVRNVPGVALGERAPGDFSGAVEFQLDHQSHSNPSAFGVMEQRKRQESTWGAATLDFADLQAALPGKDGEEPADVPPVLGNVRILRSGMEIFAFLEWTGESPRGTCVYHGAIRLGKVDAIGSPAVPLPTPKVKITSGARTLISNPR